VSGNGVALDAAPDLPPLLSLVQRFLGLEVSQMGVLLHLIGLLLEKLEPVLAALGVRDVVSGLFEHFLLNPSTGLSGRDLSHND